MKFMDVERAALFVLWAVLIVVFGLWPGLDVWFSALFYRPGQGFVTDDTVLVFNDAVPWGGRALLLLTLGLLLLARLKPAAVSLRMRRNALLLLLSLVLGLGLLVHELFKNQWGRARPHAVTQFGGTASFTSPLRPAKQCQRNCSFVSGHAATGFALVAVGLLGSARRRWPWLAAGVVSGLLIGLVRIMLGDHFLSDILFGLAFMWSASLLIRRVWLGRVWQRWQRQRQRTA